MSSNSWKNLHSIILSFNKSIQDKGHVKILNLKQLKDDSQSCNIIMIDIRAYWNERATKKGVCLTLNEFKWFGNRILYELNDNATYSNNANTRALKLLPRSKKFGGIIVSQRVGDKVSEIRLTKKEITCIVHNYAEIYDLADIFENDFHIEDDEENEEE